MLACLSHASRWTPENDSHPVGAEALQCLSSMLAAEGAAHPPDLSGFTAKEARELFPCLREWSECFTETLIAHARKLTHEKAKRPREDDAAVSLSQVERARATPPHPAKQARPAAARCPVGAKAAETLLEEAAKSPAPAPGLRAKRRPGGGLTPQEALALLSAARQARQAPPRGATVLVHRARRGGTRATAVGRGNPPADETPDSTRDIRKRRRHSAEGARKAGHRRAAGARNTSSARRGIAGVRGWTGVHAPDPDGRAVARIPRVEAFGIPVCLGGGIVRPGVRCGRRSALAAVRHRAGHDGGALSPPWDPVALFAGHSLSPASAPRRHRVFGGHADPGIRCPKGTAAARVAREPHDIGGRRNRLVRKDFVRAPRPKMCARCRIGCARRGRALI